MRLQALFLAVVASLALGCHGGRILAIFQSQTKSSFLAYEPLVRELATRGHHVTVIGSFPRKKAVGNYTDIYVPAMETMPSNGDAQELNNAASVRVQGIRRCRYILRQDPVKKLIGSLTFDLILVEFSHHQCFLGFAHNASSLIGLSAVPGDAPSAHDLLGNTSPYSYVPDPLAATLTHRMTFTQRLANAASLLGGRLRARLDDSEYQTILRDYFGQFGPLPSVAELQRKMAFVFFNTDVSLGYPRPLLPNMADVAGLHIRPARKLGKELQTFLDGSQADVLVVDMGSLPSQAIDKKLQHAFSKLRQSVLWKRDDRLLGPTPNVRVKKSLPLADVLAHPKVRALITHGDLLTIQDAVYHAVPMVGIPLEPGHAHNVLRARDLGFALQLDEGNVSSESVQWAVDTVIGQISYKQSALAASELFRDQPIPPLDKAVYWTEYVMRYKGAGHLQTPARDMPWYQYFLVDVMALLALQVLLVALLAYKMLRVADNYFFGYEDVEPITEAEEEKKTN